MDKIDRKILSLLQEKFLPLRNDLTILCNPVLFPYFMIVYPQRTTIPYNKLEKSLYLTLIYTKQLFQTNFISTLLKDYMYLRAQNKNKLIQDL